MSEHTHFDIDSSWQGVVRWGGASLLAAGGIVLLFIVSVFVSQQTLPVPPDEMLKDPTVPTALFVLAAAGELLLMPGILGIYFSLERVGKTQMFIAAALWLLSVPMFLVSRSLIIGLSRVSDSYTGTASDVSKAAYLAAADYAIEAQSILAAMGVVFLATASIIIGWVMLKSGFGRRMGYLLIGASLLTLFSPFGVIMTDIPVVIPLIGLVVTGIWQVLVGYKLYSVGKHAEMDATRQRHGTTAKDKTLVAG